MAKRNQPEGPQGVPEWMTTYGDMVTLLMCFFVLLFAFSTIDNKKFIQVMNSFQGGAGVMMSGTSISESDLIFDGGPEQKQGKSDSDSKYRVVYVKTDKNKADVDDILKAVATNGLTKDPGNFKWQISNEDVAKINQSGEIEILKNDQFTVFAMDKKSGVVGVYHVNSKRGNIDAPELQNPSSWAKGELQKAVDMDMVPMELQNLDVQASITRREFCAIVVKLYEKLSESEVTHVPDSPFIDTDDKNVLKAYGLGIVAGMTKKLFKPDDFIDREQMATMLTRTYKRYLHDDWTLENDKKFSLDISGVKKFDDDKDISSWAKESVYFMYKHGVISGMGMNMFAPKSYQTEETAMMYADSTREQAIIISLRMVMKLKKQ